MHSPQKGYYRHIEIRVSAVSEERKLQLMCVVQRKNVSVKSYGLHAGKTGSHILKQLRII